MSFEALWVSAGIVAIAEIGDRTQLLTLMLVGRLRHPWPIMGGILAATLANHVLAASVGRFAGSLLGDDLLRWLLGLSFIAMALWALKPDHLDGGEAPVGSRFGAFVTTFIAFFLVEMGDKTQIATAALGARYNAVVIVTIGSTLGMMIANAPLALWGGTLMKRLPLKYMRWFAAALFIVIGVLTLVEM